MGHAAQPRWLVDASEELRRQCVKIRPPTMTATASVAGSLKLKCLPEIHRLISWSPLAKAFLCSWLTSWPDVVDCYSVLKRLKRRMMACPDMVATAMRGYFEGLRGWEVRGK